MVTVGETGMVEMENSEVGEEDVEEEIGVDSEVVEEVLEEIEVGLVTVEDLEVIEEEDSTETTISIETTMTTGEIATTTISIEGILTTITETTTSAEMTISTTTTHSTDQTPKTGEGIHQSRLRSQRRHPNKSDWRSFTMHIRYFFINIFKGLRLVQVEIQPHLTDLPRQLTVLVYQEGQ